MKYQGKSKFNISEHLATLSTSPKGRAKELNLVNEAPPKYDLRDWSPDHTKQDKGDDAE